MIIVIQIRFRSGQLDDEYDGVKARIDLMNNNTNGDILRLGIIQNSYNGGPEQTLSTSIEMIREAAHRGATIIAGLFEQRAPGIYRNHHLNKTQLEKTLLDNLGIRHFIWLHGHVDTLARFINPTTVVAPRTPRNHHDHRDLERNWEILQAAVDQNGSPLNTIALPVPESITYSFPLDATFDVARKHLPASYANFFISNGAVFVPTYGQHTVREALKSLNQAMPEHDIIPIPSKHLIVGLGSLHCLTLQQPTASAHHKDNVPPERQDQEMGKCL